METALPRPTAYAADCGPSAAPVRADDPCLGDGASKMTGSRDGNPANDGWSGGRAGRHPGFRQIASRPRRRQGGAICSRGIRSGRTRFGRVRCRGIRGFEIARLSRSLGGWRRGFLALSRDCTGDVTQAVLERGKTALSTGHGPRSAHAPPESAAGRRTPRQTGAARRGLRLASWRSVANRHHSGS